MELNKLILKNRSYRRFDEAQAVARETLVSLVELARHSATGGNLQPLKFLLACDPADNERIFPHLAWAGYLEDWPGPGPGQRPSAYIVILGDTEIRDSFGCDHGIAAQSIMLGAAERGLGGCMIGAVNRNALRRDLALSERYQILLVLALGTPAEEVVLETTTAGGDIRYWRDVDGVHHVPKRPLPELLLN